MAIKDIVKCFHRHNVSMHPACFAQGRVVDGRKPADRKIPWYQEPGLKIGYLDIETDNLKANFGNILTWCIKEKGGKILSDRIQKRELFNGSFDRRITQSVVDAMREFNILVSYFGTGFDFPFLRTRALYYGIDFPDFGEIYHWDLYYTVRNKLKLHRSSLKVATEFLGIAGKTDIDWDNYKLARFGNKDALDEIMVHNVGDVEILELLHEKLAPFQKWNRKSI